MLSERDHKEGYISDYQGGRGHWIVNYTSPQSNVLYFSYSLDLQLWGILLNFD